MISEKRADINVNQCDQDDNFVCFQYQISYIYMAYEISPAHGSFKVSE